MQITLTQETISKVKHLRGCLKARTVDLGALDQLLSELEERISPPVRERQKRNFLRPTRVSRHLQKL